MSADPMADVRRPSSGSSSGLAEGRVVKAVHGRQAPPSDPEFEAGLRAHLRAAHRHTAVGGDHAPADDRGARGLIATALVRSLIARREPLTSAAALSERPALRAAAGTSLAALREQRGRRGEGGEREHQQRCAQPDSFQLHG